MSKERTKIAAWVATGISVAAFGVFGILALKQNEAIDDLSNKLQAQKQEIQILKQESISRSASFDADVEVAIEKIVDRKKKENEARLEKERLSAIDNSENGFVNEDGFLVYGSKDARFTVHIFEDYRCQYCEKYHPLIKNLVDQSGGLISMAYRPFPVLGEASNYLAIAAECVLNKEGPDAAIRYSEQAYASKNWKSAIQYSQLINVAEVEACVYSNEHFEKISDSIDYGKELGVQGTPASIFVNNKTKKGAFVPGNISYEDVLRMLKEVDSNE